MFFDDLANIARLYLGVPDAFGVDEYGGAYRAKTY